MKAAGDTKFEPFNSSTEKTFGKILKINRMKIVPW